MWRSDWGDGNGLESDWPIGRGLLDWEIGFGSTCWRLFGDWQRIGVIFLNRLNVGVGLADWHWVGFVFLNLF